MGRLSDLLYVTDIQKTKKVDFLNDRIQPFILFKMPDKTERTVIPERHIYSTWDNDDLTKTWEEDL